jgi:hypothetical protein
LIVAIFAMASPMTSETLLLGLPHALLVALTAPVLIVGGVRMKQLESRWLGLLAAIVALLPLNPAWLIGLPAGIWALVVLNRRDVEQAFAGRAAAWEDWQHSLGKAAVLLKITSILNVLFLAPLWVYYAVERPGAGEWWEVTIFLSLVSGAAVLAAVVMTAGAQSMTRGDSWGWSLAASLAALLPITPAVLIGLPAGLYALSLLTRPGARSWFATPPSKELTGVAP